MRTNAGILLTGRLVTPSAIINDRAVVLDGDRIAFAGKASEVPEQWSEAQRPDGWTEHHTLLPGLVDVHCHGGAGGEFGPDAASARVAADYHHRSGTTSLLGSLVSNTRDALIDGVTTCAVLVAQGDLAGIHLEGPFLSMERRGAQNPAALCDVDAALVGALAEAATAAGAPTAIAQMTFAPERPARRLSGAVGFSHHRGRRRPHGLRCRGCLGRTSRQPRRGAAGWTAAGHPRLQRYAAPAPPRAGPGQRRPSRRPW